MSFLLPFRISYSSYFISGFGAGNIYVPCTYYDNDVLCLTLNSYDSYDEYFKYPKSVQLCKWHVSVHIMPIYVIHRTNHPNPAVHIVYIYILL